MASQTPSPPSSPSLSSSSSTSSLSIPADVSAALHDEMHEILDSLSGLDGKTIFQLSQDEFFIKCPAFGDQFYFALQVEKAEAGLKPIRIDFTALDETRKVWLEITSESHLRELLKAKGAVGLRHCSSRKVVQSFGELEVGGLYEFCFTPASLPHFVDFVARNQFFSSLTAARKELVLGLQPRFGRLFPQPNVITDPDTGHVVFEPDSFYASETHVVIHCHRHIVWNELSLCEMIAQLKTHVARFLYSLESGRFPQLSVFKNHTVRTVLSSRYCCEEIRGLAKRNADFVLFSSAYNLERTAPYFFPPEFAVQFPPQANFHLRSQQALRRMVSTLSGYSLPDPATYFGPLFVHSFPPDLPPTPLSAISQRVKQPRLFESASPSPSTAPPKFASGGWQLRVPKEFSSETPLPTMLVLDLDTRVVSRATGGLQSLVQDALLSAGFSPSALVRFADEQASRTFHRVYMEMDDESTVESLLATGLDFDGAVVYPEQLMYYQAWKFAINDL